MKTVACTFISLWLVAAACSGKKKVTGMDLYPEMQETDSLDLIFFKTPEDQRWFTYAPSTDKELINALVSDVSGEVQPENPCLKEGKIYCYKKGQIFNTIYFAYLDENCRFMRYIKNGNLYYFPLSETVQKKLAEFKAIAKEPVSPDSVITQ